jgi:hypothetical protein
MTLARNPVVWKFGAISAVVSIALMLVVIPLMATPHYRYADVLGYSSMVLAALLVFFGIRSYRDQTAPGPLTFGRAFMVGLLITLISCVSYVIAFQIIYFALVPDFGDRFVICMIDRSRDDGGTSQQIEAARLQALSFKQLYDHPVTNAALTFATTIPIGLVATAVSAAILRQRPSRGDP